MRRIMAKLGNMRKPVDWVVYPAQADTSEIIIQSKSRIARFDPATGDGVLSVNKPNGAYFIHLAKFLGATPVTVPADVIAAVLAAQPKKGDEIGPGVVAG